MTIVWRQATRPDTAAVIAVMIRTSSDIEEPGEDGVCIDFFSRWGPVARGANSRWRRGVISNEVDSV
jgi:hypothetical protein